MLEIEPNLFCLYLPLCLFNILFAHLTTLLIRKVKAHVNTNLTNTMAAFTNKEYHFDILNMTLCQFDCVNFIF